MTGISKSINLDIDDASEDGSNAEASYFKGKIVYTVRQKREETSSNNNNEDVDVDDPLDVSY